MTASREDAIAAVRSASERALALAGTLSEADWQRQVYDNGWTVKQVFAHLASMGNSASFFLSMAGGSGPPGGFGAFDIDAFNAGQVASRESLSVAQLLDEVRSGHEAGAAAVAGASDELLQREMSSPAGGTYPVVDVIIGASAEHEQMHLADVRRALGR